MGVKSLLTQLKEREFGNWSDPRVAKSQASVAGKPVLTTTRVVKGYVPTNIQ